MSRALLEQLALETWERIALGWRYDCHQGEETMTDLNLLELKRLGGSRVHLVKVTKTQESVWGVDWLWYLQTGGVWYQYAVQAKKIETTGTYKELRHKVEKSKTFQIDLLEAYAKGTGAVPLYCLFNRYDAARGVS